MLTGIEWNGKVQYTNTALKIIMASILHVQLVTSLKVCMNFTSVNFFLNVYEITQSFKNDQ